jgi:hypothetical protein
MNRPSGHMIRMRPPTKSVHDGGTVPGDNGWDGKSLPAAPKGRQPKFDGLAPAFICPCGGDDHPRPLTCRGCGRSYCRGCIERGAEAGAAGVVCPHCRQPAIWEPGAAPGKPTRNPRFRGY